MILEPICAYVNEELLESPYLNRPCVRIHPWYLSLGLRFLMLGFEKEALVHYQLASINFTSMTYWVLNVCERLNHIYETGMELLEFRALYFLKSIPVSSQHFFQNRLAEKWNRSWIKNLPTKDNEYDLNLLTVVGEWDGDIFSLWVDVVPTKFMSIEDLSDKVGHDRAYSLILIAHRDW